MEGFEDPFNRRTYPWGEEDGGLLAWFSALGCLRKGSPALRRGELQWLAAEGPVLAVARAAEGQTRSTALNLGESRRELPLPAGTAILLGEGRTALSADGRPVVMLPPVSGTVLSVLDPGTPLFPRGATTD